MKICIEQGKNKNFKIFHGNVVGDMAEAFAGFSDLCDNMSDDKSSTNNNNNQYSNPLEEGKKSEETQLAIKYLGDYHGIQSSYFLKNQYGDDMVINGQKVPVASSDFKFLLKENGVVSLQQTNLEDNSRNYYDGTYKIISDGIDNIILECSLSDGKSSNPTYNLTIGKTDKNSNCIGHNEPEFNLEKIESNALLNANSADSNNQSETDNQANEQLQENNDQLANVSNNSASNEIESINEILSNLYRSIDNNTFSAKAFFAEKVLCYINHYNIKNDEIDSLYSIDSQEFQEYEIFLHKESIKMIMTSGKIVYYTYWLDLKCFRKSKNKTEKCKVNVEVGFDENKKIVFLKELKIEDLKFY